MSLIPNLVALSGQVVGRKRPTKSTRLRGREVEGKAITTENIPASVQPPFGKYRQMIANTPEGKRSKEWLVVYTALDAFRAIDQTTGLKADILTYNGADYEVFDATPRSGLRLQHLVVLAVRV